MLILKHLFVAANSLLANVNGKLSAMSAKCTHYGAPLANGVMTGAGKIICPWHGACFDAKTGDIEDAPALDNLLTFKVETDDNGDVFVEADADKLQGKPGVPTSCASSTASSADQHGIVIIGGGSAAINAVESARKVRSEPKPGVVEVFTDFLPSLLPFPVWLYGQHCHLHEREARADRPHKALQGAHCF